MTDCGHDGWAKGCPTCEAEHEAALRAAGMLDLPEVSSPTDVVISDLANDQEVPCS